MLIWLVRTGVILDIVGVWLLFRTSKPERIEAHWSVALVRHMTPKPGMEWGLPYSPAQHERSLNRAERTVRQNTCTARVALGLVLVGFVLQLLATWSE